MGNVARFRPQWNGHGPVPHPDVFEEVRAVGIRGLAERLGIKSTERSVGCPACGAEQRGESDRRLPANLSPDHKAWHCHRCGAGGDAVDFIAFARLGRRPQRNADLDRVAQEARQLLRGIGSFSDRVVPPASGVNPQPSRLATSELLDFLYAHVRLPSEDIQAARYLVKRGLSVNRIEADDLARVLDACAPCPEWARFGRRSWAESGHRILLRLYDTAGQTVSVVARRVGDERPKALLPRGRSVRGLVLANDLARRWLAGVPADAPAAAEVRRRGLVVVEGVTDFLTVAAMFEDVGAVLGVFAGSWTQALADRIPDGTRVIVATDLDGPGEGYWEAIRRTLDTRAAVTLARWRGPHTEEHGS